jgi:hypothetical protein
MARVAEVDAPEAVAPAGRAPLIGRAIVVATVVAVTVEVLRVDGGVAGTELASSWQLLDLAVLESDPLRGVWYLHTQPPLHNLLIGLIAWSPLPLAGTVFVLYAGCLLATGLLLHDLLLRRRVPVAVATVAACLAVANPALLSTVRIASYEVPLAMMLVALVWLVDRYVDEPSPATLAGVVGVGLAMVLTRSLYHPLWLAAVLVVVLVARPPSRRHLALCIGVPLLLVGGWTLKNAALVDSASLSSWTGFNLHRGVLGPIDAETVDAAVADGEISALAAERPWLPLDAYEPWLDGCTAQRTHPALADEVRRVGSVDVPNFNHECYVGLYQQSSSDALTMIRREPTAYAGDRLIALGFSHAYTPLGHDSDLVSLLGEPLPSRSWMDGLFSLLMLRTTFDIDASGWNVPLYGDGFRIELAWPLLAATLFVMVRAAIAAPRWWRGRGAPTAMEVVWLVSGLTVLAVVVGGSLIELGENGRFRSMLDPLLFGLVAVGLTDLAARLRRSNDG